MSTSEIIKSFDTKDELNPKIWYSPNEKYMGDSDGQKMKMKPEVRERLLEIAQRCPIHKALAGEIEIKTQLVN